MTSKRTLTVLSVIVDFTIWVAVSVGSIVLAYNLTELEPVERGFFCDDQTIQYPYKPDTVSDAMVIIISVILPAFVMFVLEFIHALTNKKSSKGEGSKLFRFIVSLYRVIGTFLAGGTGTILITEVLKLLAGRLRPNYLDVCEANYSKINCSLGYIIPPADFCNNTDAKMLLDASAQFIAIYTVGIVHDGMDNEYGVYGQILPRFRKSFPSGHASISAYGAVFLLVILQRRFIWRQFKLIPPLIQAVVFCVGIYVSISRVTDHRHHVTDVIGGGVIGAVVAVFMIFCVMDVSTSRKKENNDTSYTLNAVTNGRHGEIPEMYTSSEIKQRNTINNADGVIPNV